MLVLIFTQFYNGLKGGTQVKKTPISRADRQAAYRARSRGQKTESVESVAEELRELRAEEGSRRLCNDAGLLVKGAKTRKKKVPVYRVTKPLSGAERQAAYVARRRGQMAESLGSSTRIQVSHGPVRRPEYVGIWKRASNHFRQTFTENSFGHKCDVCYRIWFLRDLKSIAPQIVDLLTEDFADEDISAFKLCSACFKNCRKHELPAPSRNNGYEYPPLPSNLGKLDLISERLIPPRLPYMQIRRLRRMCRTLTLDQVEDRSFVERLIDTNQCFLRSIPNSAQYWAFRKKDVFAMIRQLGTPTAFLTLQRSQHSAR